MLQLNDITITKLEGGLGRREPNYDGVAGLIATAIEIPGCFYYNKVYRFLSLKDAENLGINYDYDFNYSDDYGILLYEHIKEFFRINPNGELWFMIVPMGTCLDNILDHDFDLAAKLVRESGWKIRLLGVLYKPCSFDEIVNGIYRGQAFHDWTWEKKAPVEVILEGRGFDFYEYRQLECNCPNVSVMIGQNYNVANLNDKVKDYGAVGTLLGALSRAAVNECIAWVEKFNMYDKDFYIPSICGEKISDIGYHLEFLNGYGYIFFRTYPNKSSGIYFNDSHTCVSLDSDYAYIENNRTINKAARNIYKVLLPRLAMPVIINPDNGTLSPEVIKQFENDGKRALEQMASDGEISSFDIYVDPKQNILATSELKVQFSLVPTGTARKITATIGFVNPF